VKCSSPLTKKVFWVSIVMAKDKSDDVEASVENNATNRNYYSRRIGVRLAQALARRGWTQSRLAKKLGITDNTMSRIISGQERLNMNLCCQAIELLGFAPESLLSDDPIMPDSTGIAAIDRGILDIFGELTQSGVETLGQYITKDYICCSQHYVDVALTRSIHDDIIAIRSAELVSVYTLKEHGRHLNGISYDTERRMNLKNSYGTTFYRYIQSLFLLDENKVVVASNNEKKSTSNNIIEKNSIIEVYQLVNGFQSISRGAQFLIDGKTWFKVRGEFQVAGNSP
jgi:transcriptional regulator with XRE-family HTH domain